MNEQYVKIRIEQYAKQQKLYGEFAAAVLSIIKNIIEQEFPDIKIAAYSSRAKGIKSLEKKLSKDKYTQDSEITDLAGARIITYSKKDGVLIADIVKNTFTIDEENSVDKTLGLGKDRVGYRGDHYVVSFGDDRVKMRENRRFKGLKCEVQITSLIAHTWSEITHEKGYKFESELPDGLERRKNLLAGMLELADLEMDAYVEEFDAYAKQVEENSKNGCLEYFVNSMSLERFMAWKFPSMQPHAFRDIELILNELNIYGIRTIRELNALITPTIESEINETGWRSLDGIIRNILIINDPINYFENVWNPSMNQMNIKNFELYKKFNIDIEKICTEKGISVV